MRRVLVAIRIVHLYFLVKRKWLNQDFEQFQAWLVSQRKKTVPLSSSDLIFYSVWIARSSGWLHPRYACVLASCTVYLLAPTPVKLFFGVQPNTVFAAHAWAEWSGGSIQMDSKRKYEPLWELSS